jgi:hypothetical protein
MNWIVDGKGKIHICEYLLEKAEEGRCDGSLTISPLSNSEFPKRVLRLQDGQIIATRWIMFVVHVNSHSYRDLNLRGRCRDK